MATNTSVSRSAATVSGCRAPRAARSVGSVTSTVSAVRIRSSRSISSSCWRRSSAARTWPRAPPTRLPASALAAGGSAPISALASVSGARSPKRASRAPFRSPRAPAAAMAASASPVAWATACGARAATSTGSYCLLPADIPVLLRASWKSNLSRLAESARPRRSLRMSPPAPAPSGEVGRPGGHGKSELRPAFGGTQHGDRTVVRLHQALHDEQAQARAAAALGPPERPGHPRGDLGGHALALVAHGHRDPRDVPAPVLTWIRWLHHNSYGPSAVPHGVLHEVAEDLVDLVLVQPGFREGVVHFEPEPVRLVARRDPAGDRLLRAGGNVHQLPVYLEPPGLDPGHVQQLGDEPGHPVGVGVDRLEHDPLLVVVEAVPLGQQRGGESLDAGQRGAQFVRHGGDQVGAAAVQPCARLRAAQA